MIFNSTKFNAHWSEKSLSSLGTFKRGKSKHRPRNDSKLFKNGAYPLIQTGEIKNAHLYINSHNTAYNEFGLAQSKIWPKNTLCITIAANIAETGILEYPMCFPDSVVGFIADQNQTSELFMHYVFSYIRNTIQKTASGSIQDNINIEFLTDLIFKIPAKKTQDSICNVLENIDKKIELNNKINIELEAMAKLIYDYWFVQFDFPDENGKPYKSSGGKMVYNKELKREIPYEWTSNHVGKLLVNDLSKQKVPKRYYQKKGIIPVIDQSSDFIAGYTDDHSSLIETEEPRIIFGDHTRIFKLVNFNFARGADGTKCLLSKNRNVPQHFFYHSLLKIDLSNYGYSRYFKFLKESQIIVPTFAVSSQFEKITNSLYSQIKNNIFETIKLEELRDWLLPMLMNGQVTVGETN